MKEEGEWRGGRRMERVKENGEGEGEWRGGRRMERMKEKGEEGGG